MIVNLKLSCSYAGMMRNLLLINQHFPAITQLKTLGYSCDRREIPFMKLGKGQQGTLYIAGVHARETINPVVMTAIIERIVRIYYSSGEDLLDHSAMYFIPLLNPDGYEITFRGFRAIRNEFLRYTLMKKQIPSDSGIFYKKNARGVDINRNFPCQSFSGSQEFPEPASESETKALICFCERYKPLGMIDYHSRGNTIYYHRAAMQAAYNRRQYRIAKRLAGLTGYSLNLPADENPDNHSGGNTVQYFSENFQKPALTIETVNENATFPLDPSYQLQVFEEIKDTPLLFLKECL